MGKRGGGKRREGAVGATSSSSGLHTQLSLREEASGRKQSHNPKSILKLKHLQNLAQWASGTASVPSLGAFYGRRFAEFGEALGISHDSSLFPRQRCETILQPGFNCTVRIEKNRGKKRRCSKTNPPVQNNVVYKCHFCSHWNLKRGTPKGYVREIAPLKTKTFQNAKAENSTAHKCEGEEKSDVKKVESYEATEPPSPSPASNITNSITDSAPAPLVSTGAKLLDSNKRKRKKQGSKGSTDESMVSSAPADAEKAGGTSRKRKKSWTTLKEIAANEEHERNQRFKNFSIPFLL